MTLGPDIEVRKSRIDGLGIFALRHFAPGEIVVAWDLSNTLTDAQYAQLPEEQRRYVIRYKNEWIYMLEPARFVNHSCDANTRVLNGADVAVKDIEPNDEVTSDYRDVMPQGERMDCSCGARSCMGYIVGNAA